MAIAIGLPPLIAGILAQRHLVESIVTAATATAFVSVLVLLGLAPRLSAMRQAVRRPPEFDLDLIPTPQHSGSRSGLLIIGVMGVATGLAATSITPDFIALFASFYIGMLVAGFVLTECCRQWERRFQVACLLVGKRGVGVARVNPPTTPSRPPRSSPPSDSPTLGPYLSEPQHNA